MLRAQPLSMTPLHAENLLPTGLPDLLEYAKDTQPTLLYYSEQTQEQEQEPVPIRTTVFEAISSDVVVGEVPLVLPDKASDEVLFLGPRVPKAERSPITIELPFRLDAKPQTFGAPKAIGIIDAGIAFWNPAFTRQEGGRHVSRFHSFGALNMDHDRSVVLDKLTEQQIADMVRKGATAAGDARNRQILAAEFPSSVFAAAPNERPLFPADGLAHGTAMTDMVLTTADPGSRLHGLELPRAVLRDLSGGLMRMVFDLALRALVKNAIGDRPEDHFGPPFDIVILAAFGFLGGPQSAALPPPDFLANIQQTLNELSKNGISVTLVLPMGNHRQDRAHARLTDGQSVGWQIQPDDHSANTLEIIHRASDQQIALTPPGGTPAGMQVQNGQTSFIELDGRRIGAITTTPVKDVEEEGWSRTRLCLAPTASIETPAPRPPFGKWTICMPGARDVRLWVMRDETGFEADPRQPARSSWLVDPRYQDRDATGAFRLDDPQTPGLRVLRKGTASVLTAYPHKTAPTATQEAIIPVAAGWSKRGSADVQETPYSGASFDGRAPNTLVDLALGAAPGQDPIGPLGQRAVLGNGSKTLFRASGTSLAAALEAGRLARGQSNSGSSLA